MADGAGPVLDRRRLAAELRRLRSAAGKTIYDVAESMECSSGKISRIETGAVRARLQDVREMLDLYGVSGAKREELLGLVRLSRQKPWWNAYSDVVPPGSGMLYGLETAAATINEHSAALVPGLLQTVGYAEALIGSPSAASAETVRRRVELRMRRQELLGRPEGPAFTAVIGEAALREPIGGAEVMAEQLRHLAAMSRRRRVTILVRPFGAGRTPAVGSSFVIFGFADPAYDKVVYVEQLTRNSFIEETNEVEFYESVFADIRKCTLNATESASMLTELAESLS